MAQSNTIRIEIDRCTKCGKCLSVCPSYIATLDEVRVSRGRIALFDSVLDGKLAYTGRVAEAVQSCLGCLRCESVCPTGVEYFRVLTELKRRLPRVSRLTWWNRLVFRWVLTRRRLMDALVRAAAVFQRVLPKGRGLTRHLPLLFRGGRRLPELSKRTALRAYGTDRKLGEAAGSPAGAENAVYFFPGCMTNYAYAHVADSIVNVLRHFGFDVVVPRDQVCCGTPVLSLGDIEQAKRLARTNMRAMPGTAPIVTGCASCGETLKNAYRTLLGDEAEPFSSRVYDFAEFLDRFVDFPAHGIPARVVYHDPCHLRFGQGVFKAPRRLLEKAADYREVEGADLCCGMAGLFSVHHYGLATRIARRKTDSLRGVEAELLVTECPGCVAQLRDRLEADGVELRVVHLAELLEKALGLKRAAPEDTREALEDKREKVEDKRGAAR
ncbi:MAG: (Fe-S)-binding protein [Verrucomicrobia bacterium]|nr:(Fe-S)-binding protein [Verrucomicrobiota bacterium]